MEQDLHRRTPPPEEPSGSRQGSSFVGLVASLEADLARDLERIAVASEDLAVTRQRTETTTSGGSLGSRLTTVIGKAMGGLRTGLLRGQDEPAERCVESTEDAHGSREALTAASRYTDSLRGVSETNAGETLDAPACAGPATGSLGHTTGSGPHTEFDPRGRTAARIRDMADSTQHKTDLPGLTGRSTGLEQTEGGFGAVDRLHTELKQARDELSALQAKAGKSDSGNGSSDAQRRKLDQRAMELRERVIRAQQALDERAKKLRQSLAEERERLKAYHAQLQRKARQLDEASRQQLLAIDGDVAKQREAVELERAKLDRRRIELDALEAELREEVRQDLAKRRAEMEQSVRERLAELQNEVDSRQTHLDEKERGLVEKEAGVEQIIQKRAIELKHQTAQRELVLEQKERSLEIREKQIRNAVSARLEQVKNEASSWEADLLAREKALAEQEASIKNAIDSHLAALEKEQAEKKAEYEAKLRDLFEREGQLNRTHETRMAELRREWEAKEAEFQSRSAMLTTQEEQLRKEYEERIAQLHHDAELRQKEYESRLKALGERDTDLQEAVSARLAEVKREAAARQAEFEAREKALREREADLQKAVDAKLSEMRRATETKAAELEGREKVLVRRENELEQTIRGRIADMERSVVEKRSEMDRREKALAETEGDLRGRREAFDKTRDAKEAEFRAKAHELTELAKLYGDKTSAEATLAARRAELEMRRDELSRRSEDIENRERRLREWQTRLESIEPGLEAARLDLQRRQALAEQIEKANLESTEKLEARKAELRREQDELGQRGQQLRARLDELSRTEAALRAQSDDLRRQKQELGDQERRLKNEREQYAELQKQSEALDRQRQSMDEREAEFNQREQAIREKESWVAREVAESEDQRRRLETMRSDLQRQEQRVQEQLAQAKRLEEETARARVEIEGERQRLAEGEKRVQEVDRRQAELDEATAAVQRERDRLTADRVSFDRMRAELEQHSVMVARERDELSSRKATLESEWSNLERDRSALRDRERALTEQKARLETAQREVEEYHRDLRKRSEETEEFRRTLAEKAERMKLRKARLIEDASLVESKIKQINSELETVRLERQALADQRRTLEEEAKGLSSVHKAFECERDEFDASRRKLDEAKAAFEAQQRGLGEREARLSERANQLEAFAQRLKQEYNDVQKRRAELVEIETRGDTQEKLNVLLSQVEERQAQLNRRAEALKMQEKALSVVAAEISETENEIKRQAKEGEARSRELENEIKAMDQQRKDFEEASQAQCEEIAHLRRQAEQEIARERERLRARDRELDVLFAKQRDAQEFEGDVREEANYTEMRRRVEASLAERIAEVSRKEQQAEYHFRQRLAEVEELIAQQWAQADDEMKARSLQAEQELAVRRSALEAEHRRIQASLGREPEEAGMESSAGVADFAEKVDDQPNPKPTALVPADERVWLDDSAEEIDERAAEIPQTQSMPVAAHAPEASGSTQADVGAPRRRWVRAAVIFILALLSGGVGGGAYLWWIRTDAVEVHGRLMLLSQDPVAMTAQEHVAAILKPEVLEEASKRIGADIRKLFRERQLHVADAASSKSVELVVRSSPSDQAAAKNWLAGIAAVYQETLGRAAASREEIARRTRRLESDRQEKSEQLQEMKRSIERMETDLASQSSASDVLEERKRKDQLKSDVAKAIEAVHYLKNKLSALRAEPEPEGPGVPTQAQLEESFASDAELTQALAHQTAKAREFHDQLKEATAKSKAPLEAMIHVIEEWRTELGSQLNLQTDNDIHHELELLDVDLRDYLQQARNFERQWNELTPKVEAWSGGDPDALLEYQKQAETIVREFHAKSRDIFAQAAKKADDIGRSGSEMTKRRIVQSTMTRLAHESLAARNNWTVAARNVVPRYNVELQTLRDAVTDVGPRINERRDYHQKRLAERLTQARVENHRAAIEKARADLEAATRRHQQLSDEFLKMDSAATIDDRTLAALERQRAALEQARVQAAQIEQVIEDIGVEIDHVRTSGQVTKAGTVAYEPLPSVVPPAFDVAKAKRAIGLGATIAGVFIISVWFLSRPKIAAQPTKNSSRLDVA